MSTPCVILYMAISADGFIAGLNDETPWSDDEWVAFRAFIQSCDAVLLGRRTYEIMRDQNEFADADRFVDELTGKSAAAANTSTEESTDDAVAKTAATTTQQPDSQPEYIVVTNNPSIDTGSFRKLSIQTKADLPRADKTGKIGVIGGGELNGSLVKLGIVNEIILDVEPIMIGKGKRLFGNHGISHDISHAQDELKLELIKTKRIGGGTVQSHYRIITSNMTTKGSTKNSPQ